MSIRVCVWRSFLVALWREREVYKIRIRENFDLDIWRRETVLSVIMMIELGLDRVEAPR